MNIARQIIPPITGSKVFLLFLFDDTNEYGYLFKVTALQTDHPIQYNTVQKRISRISTRSNINNNPTISSMIPPLLCR